MKRGFFYENKNGAVMVLLLVFTVPAVFSYLLTVVLACWKLTTEKCLKDQEAAAVDIHAGTPYLMSCRQIKKSP